MPEEDIHPFLPGTVGTVATELKSTLIVSSILSIRERALFDRYRRIVGPADLEVILSTIAGVWVPMELGVRHYAAVNALGLTHSQNLESGVQVGRKIQATLLGTVVRLARTSGVTPWTVLAQFQRLFERIFRGGGGTRIVKLGPKEARIEIVGLPLAEFAQFRGGFQGMIKSGGELFCTRAYVSEIPRLLTPTTIGYRCAWA